MSLFGRMIAAFGESRTLAELGVAGGAAAAAAPSPRATTAAAVDMAPLYNHFDTSLYLPSLVSEWRMLTAFKALVPHLQVKSPRVGWRAGWGGLKLCKGFRRLFAIIGMPPWGPIALHAK